MPPSARSALASRDSEAFGVFVQRRFPRDGSGSARVLGRRRGRLGVVIETFGPRRSRSSRYGSRRRRGRRRARRGGRFSASSRFEPAGRSSACSARTSGAAAEPAGPRRTRRPSRARSRFQRAPAFETSPVAYLDVPDPDATVSSARGFGASSRGAPFPSSGVSSASEASISVERRRSPGGAGSGSAAGGVQILALVASPRVTSVIPGTLARDGGDETRAAASGFSSGGTAEDALDDKERSESGGGGSSSSHGGEGASCWFGSVGPVAARVGPSGGSATCASRRSGASSRDASGFERGARLGRVG